MADAGGDTAGTWPDDARLALTLLVELADPPPGSPDETDAAYGWRAGLPRLLDVLRARGLPATIAACPLSLDRRPEVAAMIRAAGYDLCATAWTAGLDAGAEAAAIQRTRAELARLTGQQAAGWLSRPGPTPRTRALLTATAGLLYDSDATDDDRPYWIPVQGRPHLVVPRSRIADDRILSGGGDLRGLLGAAFDRLLRDGGRMLSVTLHPGLIGQPAHAAALDRFLDHALGQSDLWICRRGDLARHWVDRHRPAGRP